MLLCQFLQHQSYPKQVTLNNVPLVNDIFTMVDLLKFIGIKVNVLKKEKKL